MNLTGDIYSNQKLEGKIHHGAFPTVEIDSIENGHRVAFVDVYGRQEFDVMNGENGKDGYTPQKGIDYFDGYTPVKGVDYKDGDKGAPGEDGYTPIKGKDYFTEADKQEIAERAAEMVEVPEGDLSGVVKSVNGATPDENGNVEIEVTGDVTDEQIAQAVVDYLTKNPVAGGMTKTEKDLILSLFRNASYTSDNMGSTFSALEALWNGEAPEEPDVPVVTLTRISATYSGGSVPVGTAVTDLTGIVVTAHYSDGSTETVTGYTLSGTIAEGSNTVTVNYGGETATFTVTGIVEQASAWEDGYFTTSGTIQQADTYMYYKEYLPIAPGQKCYIYNTNNKWKSWESQYAFYDENKNFMTRAVSNVNSMLLNGRIVSHAGSAPDGAAYIRCSSANMTLYQNTAEVSINEIPEVHIPFEDVEWYADKYVNADGTIGTEGGCAVSDFVSVEPNTTYKFGNTNGSWSSNWFGIGFYRADGTFISRGSSAQFTTPSDAKYVRLSATGMTGYTETATLTKVS